MESYVPKAGVGFEPRCASTHRRADQLRDGSWGLRPVSVLLLFLEARLLAGPLGLLVFFLALRELLHLGLELFIAAFFSLAVLPALLQLVLLLLLFLLLLLLPLGGVLAHGGLELAVEVEPLPVLDLPQPPLLLLLLLLAAHDGVFVLQAHLLVVELHCLDDVWRARDDYKTKKRDQPE